MTSAFDLFKNKLLKHSRVDDEDIPRTVFCSCPEFVTDNVVNTNIQSSETVAHTMVPTSLVLPGSTEHVAGEVLMFVK